MARDKTLKKTVLDYLRSEVRFRERSAKDRGMVNLILDRYPILRSVEKDILVQAVQDYNTMDRWWRKHLKAIPELRGTDYRDKVQLEIEAQVELGYPVGYKLDNSQS